MQVARLPHPAVVGGVEGQRHGAAAQQPAVGPAVIARHPVQRQRRRALYIAGVVHRARPHRQRVALQRAGVGQRRRRDTGRAVAQQRAVRGIGQLPPAGHRQLRQPHQPPAVGQFPGGERQPLTADVALLRHPVRRQRHRPVTPHLAARAAGIVLRQGQRDVPLRLQRAVMGQRVRAQPQIFPLPLPQTAHRAGLYLPVAVAQQPARLAHRQPVAQGQPAALLRQQRAAVVQTVAGQAQRAALHAAAVGDGPRRQRQVAAARQTALIVHLTGGEPAVAVRHQRAAVAQLARPEGLYVLRQLPGRPPQRVAVRRRQRDHQVAVAVYPPAVAQAVRRQPQTARLPVAVVLCRRRRQHRRPLRQQSAGAGVGERVIGRQRQRSDTQHLPGVAHAACRDINTPALPVALIVQRGGRQTTVPLTQKPAPGLIARRPGYRQRQRVHPQQRAAVVELVRRQVQSPPFQPPGIGQRPVRRHRQRRQPGDRAAVGRAGPPWTASVSPCQRPPSLTRAAPLRLRAPSLYRLPAPP